MNPFRIPAAALLVLTTPLAAQVPRMIDYQGRIAVREVNFNGTGQFKFALVDAAGTTTWWSHDGTSANGGAPASHIAIPVDRGLYSVRLGDTSVANMAALTPAALDHPDVRLRVWFSDGALGFQQLSPDRRIASVAYSLVAESVPDGSITAESLAPGAVTSEKLAPESVTADKLAPGSVTADKLAPGVGGASDPGAVLFSTNPADPALLNAGYSALYTIPGGAWTTPSATGAPGLRRRHVAVWMGSSMIVWGGEVSGILSGQGGIYTPATDSWRLLSATTLSPARADAAAVWTGSRLLVWGGVTATGESATGAVFDPAALAWLDMSGTGAPSVRTGHTAVWTGTQMIVWGGGNASGALGDGGIYTPPPGGILTGANRGTWSPLPAGAGSPSPRRLHSAVWAGGRMIVWGGEAADGSALGNGASFNPATLTWTALPAGGPSPRMGHSAAVLDGKVVVFGGAAVDSGAVLGDGAVFDPAAGTWSPLPASGAPAARWKARAISAGSELIVVGGETGSGQAVAAAGAWNPATGLWRPLPDAPAAAGSSAVWSGQLVLTFGTNGLRTLDPKPPVTLYGKF